MIPEKIRGLISEREVRLAYHEFTKSLLSKVGLFIILSLAFITIFAGYLAPYPEDAILVHFEQSYQPPSFKHLFGTDNAGRDIFSRVLLGTKISFWLAVSVTSMAIVIGVSLGLIAGYSGGFLDIFVMRLVDLMLSIPPILLVLILCVIFTPSLRSLTFALALTYWPRYSRIVRGEVLHIKEEDYIQAARSLGGGTLRIIFKEILPNLLTPVIVKASLDMGFVILSAAAIGFLGFGVQPPIPEWGAIACSGRGHLPEMWWITIFPGIAIFITVFAFNILGDGIRDILSTG